MGSGFSGPPNESGSLPDISVPDYATIEQAKVQGQKAAGWFDWFWKALFEHFVPGASVVIGLLVSVMDSILAQALKAIAAGQGEGWAGMYSLIAATLSDLLGVEVDAGTVQTSFTQGARQANVGAFGQKFLDQLRTELSGGQVAELQASMAPAYAWLGYGMEFAIREGNIEFISKLIPEEFNPIEGLRGFGVNLAETLGLGRLTRLAMQSFMKIMVSDPVQAYLNSIYTPTILPVNSLIRAWMRGGMVQEDRDKYLSWLGYRPQDIPQLILDASTVMSENGAIAMQRTGFYTSEQLAAVLSSHGVPTDNIADFINATIAQRSETHLNGTVTQYQTLYKQRLIGHDDLITQLQNLGLSSTEISFVIGEAAPYLEYRSPKLTLAELESAFLQGLVTITDISDRLNQLGYTSADSQIWQYLLLLKQQGKVEAAELATWRLRISCLTAIAKGQPPPPGWDKTCNPPS